MRSTASVQGLARRFQFEERGLAFCRRLQLRAYQEAFPDFIARGAQLIAISPQTPDNSLTTAERHALAFPVLSDEASRVAERFGITLSIEGAMRDLHAGVGADLTAINGDPS